MSTMTELWKESVFLIYVLDFTEALASTSKGKLLKPGSATGEMPHTPRACPKGRSCPSVLCPVSSFPPVVTADMLLGNQCDSHKWWCHNRKRGVMSKRIRDGELAIKEKSLAFVNPLCHSCWTRRCSLKNHLKYWFLLLFFSSTNQGVDSRNVQTCREFL